MRRYEIKINGISPLLMHNDNLEWCEVMDQWRLDPGNKKNSKAGDDRTPAWRWIGNLYLDAGQVAVPSDNLMTVLREGGAKCPTGIRQGTFKAMTQSGIIVDQIAWPLIVNGGLIPYTPIKALIENPDFEHHKKVAEELGFELFVKRAKIGQAKHVRVRPRFNTWSCSGTITVLEDMLSTQVIENILTFAGAYSGIGDWRPSSPRSPGSFGKFVAEIKEV